MADLTSVSCSSSHKCEPNFISPTSLPHATQDQKDVRVEAHSSQSTNAESDKWQCNWNVHTGDDLNLAYSRNLKENQNVSNCMGSVHVSSSCHSFGQKAKCLGKVNGLTHSEHSSGDNGLLVNLLNSCCKEDTECHSYSSDSRRGLGSICQCIETDCDDVTCGDIGQEEKTPKVHCDTGHKEVDSLLTELEKASISEVSNFSEPCMTSNNVIDGINYVVYESEKQMPDIMRLITKDLSEPYSIYTYRYFIHNWPKLCLLAMANSKCVGAIVCKLDLHKKMVHRGYIAMLAVDSAYRRRRIGSTLVTKAIEAMIRDDCDEVVLETEITNQSALHLYENLGFVRDKRLFRYYLNGVDALRLKLWLR